MAVDFDTNKRPRVYAVDFDGTLSLGAHYPDIGAPNIPLFKALIDEHMRGNKIILWTCRDGETLDEAIKWCKDHGLIFDAVNENIVPWSTSRKIVADAYIDDLAKQPLAFIMERRL